MRILGPCVGDLLASRAKGSVVLVTQLILSLAQALALGKVVWPVFLGQSPATLWPRRYDGLLRLGRGSGVRAPAGAHGLFVLFSFFFLPACRLPACLPNHLPFFSSSFLSFPSPPLLPKFPSKLAKPADTCFFAQCFSSQGLLPASYHGYHSSSQLAEPLTDTHLATFATLTLFQAHIFM